MFIRCIGQAGFWNVEQQNPHDFPVEAFLMNKNAYIYMHTRAHQRACTELGDVAHEEGVAWPSEKSCWS